MIKLSINKIFKIALCFVLFLAVSHGNIVKADLPGVPVLPLSNTISQKAQDWLYGIDAKVNRIKCKLVDVKQLSSAISGDVAVVLSTDDVYFRNIIVRVSDISGVSDIKNYNEYIGNTAIIYYVSEPIDIPAEYQKDFNRKYLVDVYKVEVKK